MIDGRRAAGALRRRGVRVVVAVALLLFAAVGVSALPSGSSPTAVAAGGSGQLDRPLSDREVLIGAWIENIQSVDPETNSFNADLYVWLRWSNPKLEPWKTVEFMNLYQAWDLAEWPATEEPERQPDGTLYHLTHYQAVFNSRLALADYPFGTQQLRIEIEDIQNEAKYLRFVTNDSSIGISNVISIPGYHIGTPTIAVIDNEYGTDFGALDRTETNTYSRVVITTPIAHPVLTNIVKYLVPILLVMIAAGLIFQVPPGLIEGRIGLAITLLLTLVAMQWTATDGLPINEYLTLLDVLYVLSIAFILASLIVAIRVSWIARAESEERAIAIDERAMRIFYAVYGVAFASVVLGYVLL